MPIEEGKWMLSFNDPYTRVGNRPRKILHALAKGHTDVLLGLIATGAQKESQKMQCFTSVGADLSFNNSLAIFATSLLK